MPRDLVGHGASVVLADVNRAAGEALVAELGAAARFAPTDVTSEADGQAAERLAFDAFGRLNGLVNCAGIARGEKAVGRGGPHRLDTFARAATINVTGTFNMIRLAAAMADNPPDGEGERGVIVNTASIAAFDGQMAGMPQEVQDSLGQSVPFPPRLGRPPEFAALVRRVFENTMLNGGVIRLDGALRLTPH